MSTVEQIKEKLAIVDVVSSYLKLEKAGKNFKTCCPFHNEKTPSFFISPERDTYHCFGCDRGGDIFSFVQEIEGVDFLGSLSVLADKAGVEIERFSGDGKEKERLYAIMDHASFYYQSLLEKESDVMEYLKKRGISLNSIKNFRIGFAQEDWRGVSSFLIEKGFKEEELEKAGLIIRKEDGRYYDRFRNRIIFPISDPSGRIVAFSGRMYLSKEDSDNKKRENSNTPVFAKYINSPETELYHKSKILYGFDKAKVAVRKEDVCIIVEGQMDVVMSVQGGVENTVATSGTALTDNQLILLSRLTHNLIVAYDADFAGITASGRGIDLALKHDFDVRIVRMKEGKDPADLVLEDTKKWRNAIKDALHIIDFLLSALRETTKDEREYRRSVEKKVLPYIAMIPSRIDQAYYISKIAHALHVNEESVWEEFRHSAKDTVSKNIKTVEGNEIKNKNDESNKLPHERRQRNIEKRILGIFLWQQKEKDPIIDIKKVQEEFEKIVGEKIEKRIEGMSPKDCEKAIFEAEAHFSFIDRSSESENDISNGDDSSHLKKEVEELFANLKEHLLRERLMKAMSNLRIAETQSNMQKVAETLELCNTISREINEISSEKNNHF